MHPGEVGDQHRHLRLLLEVGRDQVTEVAAVDVVGAHHEDHLGRSPAQVVAQPEQLVGVALGEALLVEGALALPRHDQPQATAGAVEVPGPTVAHLLLERLRLVGHREPDVVDAGVDQVGQREVEQLVGAGEGQRRLRPLRGQDVHPPPAPPAWMIATVRTRCRGLIDPSWQRPPGRGKVGAPPSRVRDLVAPAQARPRERACSCRSSSTATCREVRDSPASRLAPSSAERRRRRA